MDRGQSAVMPLLDEIVANQAEHTQVIGVGPGVRARHILSVGLDLGPAHRGAGDVSGEVLGAECLHGFLPAGEPGIRLLGSAINISCNCCPRSWPRRGALCSTAFLPTICGASPGPGQNSTAWQRRRVLPGGRGVRGAERHPPQGCRRPLLRRPENPSRSNIHPGHPRQRTDDDEVGDVAGGTCGLLWNCCSGRSS